MDILIYRYIHRYFKQAKQTDYSVKKFLQTLDEVVYTKLEKLAKKRGITVQELVRAVIIPGWLEEQKE